MRTIIRASALTLALILPVTALAVDFESIDTVADCNGWRSDLKVTFWSGAQIVYLEYVVVLSDADGNEVQRFEHSESLNPVPGGSADYSYEGAWDAQPGDGWDVNAAFTLIDIIPDLVNYIHGTSVVTVDCVVEDGGDQEGEPACTYPLSWWRRNRDAYPVDELVIGGATLGEAQIFRVLRRRGKGRPLVLLAQVLIVAKFNVLLVPDNDVGPAIAAADAYLRDNSPFPQQRRGRHTTGDPWARLQDLRKLAAPLIRFNWPGCLGENAAVTGTAGVTDDIESFENAMVAEKADEETASFSALKAMYR